MMGGRLRIRNWVVVLLALIWLAPSCKQGGIAGGVGLKPGLNYMQPMRWQMTYRYRVREIAPEQPFVRQKQWALDPTIPTVGKGTYEVWFVGPREGEELRDLKLNYAFPQPTEVSTNGEDDLMMYYYDLAPDNELPREIQLALQWEFITFERYAHWKGMKVDEYDRDSPLHKRYTTEEHPIVFFTELERAMKRIVPKDDPENIFKTSLSCYNHLLNNFNYDFAQDFSIVYGGQAMTIDSYRSWLNRTGQCDEFANVLCSMLRYADIEARPAAGFVHLPLDWEEELKEFTALLPTKVVHALPPMLAGGHAWVEVRFPGVGWVPMDPTWSMGTLDETIEPNLSLVGNLRKIPIAEYYFGKNDPYRIPMYKDWNVELTPGPRTPGAKVNEMYFVGYTERSSGVRQLTYGWEGVPGIGGG